MKTKELIFKDRPNHFDHMINTIKKGYKMPSYLKGGIAVDIGSNVGGFPFLYHTLFDRIICIEPSQNSCNKINQMLTDNNIKNVEVHKLAVSDVSDEILKLYPYDKVNNGLDNWSSNATTFKNISEEKYNLNKHEEVTSISLEDVFRKFSINKIDYLKCDCEGNEIPFLMNKDLSKIDHIGIELHYLNLEIGKNLKTYLSEHFNITGHTPLEYQYVNKNYEQK